MVASTVTSPAISRSPTNSSRNRRRRLLADREYLANSAPLTTSGRLTRQKTGRSRLVTYRRRTSASAGVNSSAAYMYMRRFTIRPATPRRADHRMTLDDYKNGVGLHPDGQIAALAHDLTVQGNW